MDETDVLAEKAERALKAHEYKRAFRALEVLSNRKHARNWPRAMSLFNMAAEGGCELATCQLGVCMHNGAGVPRDEEKGITLFRSVDVTKAADAGDWQAQFLTGYGHDCGLFGNDSSPTLAVHYYRLAVDQGHIVAANNLAVFFEKGKHATKDLAAKYYTIACEASYPIALANYGRYLGERNIDAVRSREFLERGASLGHVDSIRLLAKQLCSGVGGERNAERAERLLRDLIREGETSACATLGVLMSRQGRTIEAFELYQQQGSAGDPIGLFNVGLCYVAGKGVKCSAERGLEYLLKSSQKGFYKASMVIARTYEGAESPWGHDLRKALQFYRIAAQQRKDFDSLDSVHRLMFRVGEKWRPKYHRWYPSGVKKEIELLIALSTLTYRFERFCDCVIGWMPLEVVHHICVMLAVLHLKSATAAAGKSS